MSNDFENGGSWLLSEKNYDRYIRNQDFVGRIDGQFVAPSNQINDLLDKYPNNPREWEKALGLNKDSLGENPYRVDVFEPHKFGLREPSSDMSGANDKFIPGAGKTSGGIDEGVINPIPNPEKNPYVGKVQSTSEYYKEKNNGQNDSSYSGTNSISSKNIVEITGGGSNAPPNQENQSVYSSEKLENLEQPQTGTDNKYEAIPLKNLDPEPDELSKNNKNTFSDEEKGMMKISGKDGLTT